MFQVIVGFEEIGKYEKYSEAFTCFFTSICEQVKARTLDQRMLDTMSYIVRVDEKEGSLAMDFYDSRDFAYSIGLLKNAGELQQPEVEPSEGILLQAFAKSTIVGIREILSKMVPA